MFSLEMHQKIIFSYAFFYEKIEAFKDRNIQPNMDGCN